MNFYRAKWTMPENLISPNSHYYHPLTHVRPKPHCMTMDAEGNIVELPDEAPKLAFLPSLTDEDVTNYYYQSTGWENRSAIKRDAGSVRYLVRMLGTDVALFAIDALINEYVAGDDRGTHIPDLIKASDYASWAEDRLGVVKQIARQYGVNGD